MSNSKPPEILSKKPEPEQEWRIFHKTRMLGWSGFVKINNIHGWAYNRRIELFRRKCDKQFGRLPTDDEIYTFMLGDKAFQIKELARSILYNGVRVPIIVAADGTLLDGNRRYVSTLWAIEHNKDIKDELTNVPAWVMSKDTTDENRLKVLVECNFLSDCKVDWNNYTKSLVVYEEYADNKLTIDELSERYALHKGEARKMIDVMSFIHEFLNLHEFSDEAYGVAYKYYHFFEEAHNKCRAKLDTDPDLKEQFFIWMIEGKFTKMKQITSLSEVRDNEDAWAMIHSDHPDAVDAAIHIVQGEKLPSLAGGEKRVKKIIKSLRKLEQAEIAAIQPETLYELKAALTEVIKMAEAVIGPVQGKTNESQDS